MSRKTPDNFQTLSFSSPVDRHPVLVQALGGKVTDVTTAVRGTHGHPDISARIDDREMVLSSQDGTYGLLVEWSGGKANCRVEVLGQADITSVRLVPATEAQRKGWQRQQHDFSQFGYITVSAQRPLPGQSEAKPVGALPLAAMIEKAAFFDERLDFAVQVQNMPRLINWLSKNGFTHLRSEALRAG